MKPINFTQNSQMSFTLITNEEYQLKVKELEDRINELNQKNTENQLNKNKELKEKQALENSPIASEQLHKLLDLKETINKEQKENACNNSKIVVVGKDELLAQEKIDLDKYNIAVIENHEPQEETVLENPKTVVQIVGNDLSLSDKVLEKSRQLLNYLQRTYKNKNVSMTLELTGKHLGIMRFISNHFRIYSGNNREINNEDFCNSNSDAFLSSSYVNSQQIEDFLVATPIENDMFLINLEKDKENATQIPLNFESLIIQKDSKKNNKNKLAILTDIVIEENSFDFYALKELCSKENYNLDCSLLIIDNDSNSDEPVDTIEIFERKKYGK